MQAATVKKRSWEDWRPDKQNNQTTRPEPENNAKQV